MLRGFHNVVVNEVVDTTEHLRSVRMTQSGNEPQREGLYPPTVPIGQLALGKFP